MSLFASIALVLTLTALFGFVNERWLRLPTPIGLTLVALLVSLGLLVLGNQELVDWATSFLGSLDFHALLLQGLLSFILFAGSLHVNLEDLSGQGWAVVAMATVGVLLSTAVVGLLSYAALGLAASRLRFPGPW